MRGLFGQSNGPLIRLSVCLDSSNLRVRLLVSASHEPGYCTPQTNGCFRNGVVGTKRERYCSTIKVVCWVPDCTLKPNVVGQNMILEKAAESAALCTSQKRPIDQ